GEQRDLPLGEFIRQFRGLLARLADSKEAIEKYKLIADLLGDTSLVDFGRSWYRQVSGMINNVPYVFEILIAETLTLGGYYFGVNHSPTFGDYLRQSRISAGELYGSGHCWLTG
ncbi:MAG: hypothetical protein WCH01_18755, partial [Methylococcaceae bacterium]